MIIDFSCVFITIYEEPTGIRHYEEKVQKVWHSKTTIRKKEDSQGEDEDSDGDCEGTKTVKPEPDDCERGVRIAL